MNDTGKPSANSHSITQAISRVLQEGAVAVLVTLIEAPLAAEQYVGTKLLVESSGASVGSFGDAALDESVADQAVKFLAAHSEAQTFRVEDFAPALAEWRGVRLLFERVEPGPHVVVCGAGHVGAALASLSRLLGYRVTLIDDRPDFVARGRFLDAEIELIAAREGWTKAVRASVGTGRGVAVAVVTRGHNEDEECLRAVLEAKPDYVGMIGSRRRTNIVLERLRETGVEESRLREVRAPIGLDIAAVTPEEVALSILAEIIAARRGGKGAPLSAWRRSDDGR
ncbi:MAG: XdhC/CoxI family protein [Acidobacteriota bacterium]|nr:XdhC/CoxI family protein [Acidobacteriota bacterium]